MNWQRARNPEQKAERISAILDAAAEMFSEHTLSEISMSALAARAGMGKASLYGYFQSKEEVFLALFDREIHNWISDLEQRMARLRKPDTDKIAECITKNALDHPVLGGLAAYLDLALENAAHPDAVREFKIRTLSVGQRFATVMQSVIPGVRQRDTHELFMQIHVMVAGLWQKAQTSDAISEILDEPQLQVFRVDFECSFRRAVRALLRDIG